MYSEEVRKLLTEFDLEVNSGDYESTRETILAVVASLHPDKTGGVFVDEAHKSRFERALKLRDLFDQEMSASMQMVPIQQVSNLIEAIAKIHGLTQISGQPSQAGAQELYRRELKRKYALPKITSALIASICFTLFSFLGNFKNSPFYRLAVNLFANDRKVEIINKINSEGRSIKANEEHALFGDIDRYSNMRNRPRVIRSSGLINWDDWPKEILIDDYSGTQSRLELHTTISDVDLYSSDEAELFKSLEKMNIQLEKSVAPGVSAVTSQANALTSQISARTSEIKKRNPSKGIRNALDYELRDLDIPLDPYSSSVTDYYDSGVPFNFREMILTRRKVIFTRQIFLDVRNSALSANQSITDLRGWLPKAKKSALDTAERRILLILMVVTILACCALVVTWLRERSDQKWVEFVSSDEGLELVFSRLCARREIASRIPPKFQLSEFTETLATKDVPPYLELVLGKHLKGSELSPVATSLITRLKEQKIITQVKTATIKPWFEITAVDFDDVVKNQGQGREKLRH